MKKLFNLFIVITICSLIATTILSIFVLLIYGEHFIVSWLMTWFKVSISAVILIIIILLIQNGKGLLNDIKNFINT